MQDIQYGIFILTTNIISLHSHVAISQNRDVSHVCYGHEALGMETSENLLIQIKCRDLRLSMYTTCNRKGQNKDKRENIVLSNFPLFIVTQLTVPNLESNLWVGKAKLDHK